MFVLYSTFIGTLNGRHAWKDKSDESVTYTNNFISAQVLSQPQLGRVLDNTATSTPGIIIQKAHIDPKSSKL